MIANLPLPALHNALMDAPPPTARTVDEQALSLAVTAYQQATTPALLEQLATTWELRAIRLADKLPMSLINDYDRLVRLARWRATQIREDADARR